METTGERHRLQVTIQGAVQGVGFRPFVYRLATELGLVGWVNNSTAGVLIEVEGPPRLLATFLQRLHDEKPPLASIRSLESSLLPANGFTTFEIVHSNTLGAKTAFVLPDIATCPDCLREISDPANRRYRYPFTNCTNCGPRFTIIEALPYDRPNTTMKHFEMCAACRAEYENPSDRRFHAQPNACPVCGPHLELWDRNGVVLATHDEALLQGAQVIRQGKILAVKGLGGFHLIVDARQPAAVRQLRQRKHRAEKPFATMFPSLTAICDCCHASPLETELLGSPQAPVVILQRRFEADIAPEVAPDNPTLGVMLPYTPLHHLLLHELGFPVVATSGNLSDEPICTDEYEALQRLGAIADLFLVHNRPITRHVDDSVVRVMAGRSTILRRARGYAPLPVPVSEQLPPALAVGAHLKNTVAASVGHEVFISQHIGDLETAQAYHAFQKVITDLQTLYDLQPSAIACDLHPDYLSTQYAEKMELPVVHVQHHYAHILACMAENQLVAPVLGVCWDGTGYGPDGTIWGGEFLLVTPYSCERVAHLRSFALPGGDQAVKEPRRAAIGLLYEIFGDNLFSLTSLLPVAAFSPRELPVIRQMLQKGVNTPRTSSAGRLFDAVASILGLRQRLDFEGQTAMLLEFALQARSAPTIAGISSSTGTASAYPFLSKAEGYELSSLPVQSSSQYSLILDWEPLIRQILADSENGIALPIISAKFHDALTAAIVAIARRIGVQQVALTGGCFQNRYLTEQAIGRLRRAGFQPFWHRHVPPNDGGIALGQMMALAREKVSRKG